MRRIALGALLLLGSGGAATANDGPNTFGLGCWGHGLRIFPFIHQHGPLYNYGPYYGYPPFEPYGNWNSYLQYTGPTNGAYGGGGGHGHGAAPGGGAYGFIRNGHAYSWGGAGNGVHFGGGKHHGHKAGGCSSCATAAAEQVSVGNPVERYTGVGSPAASAAFYAETPSLLAPSGVVPAGFYGR